MYECLIIAGVRVLIVYCIQVTFKEGKKGNSQQLFVGCFLQTMVPLCSYLGLGELCSKTLLLCYAPMLSNALIMLLRIVIMLTVCSLYNIIMSMWSRGGELPRVTK